MSSTFWRCDRCGTPNPPASYVSVCIACGARRPPAGTETKAQPQSDSNSPLPSTAPQGITANERKRRLILLSFVVAYGVVVFFASAITRVVGDDWLIGLLLIVSPRWLFLIPAPFLFYCAWRLKRPWLASMIVLEVAFVLGPLMGFGIPWGRFSQPKVEGQTIRLMSFNRGSGSIDIARFLSYVERQKIDVICFQDFLPDKTLDNEFDRLGWHHDDNRSIVSRLPIVEQLPRHTENNRDEERYTFTAFRARLKRPDGQQFVVASVQMPTLRHGVNRLLKGKVSGLKLHHNWWRDEIARLNQLLLETKEEPILIGGDFNMPIESTSMYSLIDNTLYQSAFEEAGFGWGYTRPSSSWAWVRIDHILASHDWMTRHCWIGPDFGSDHRSIVAEFLYLPAQPAQP